MKIIIIKNILEKLLNKKISIYVKDISERSWFSGTLESISDEIIILREKTEFTEFLYYILLTEVVVVSERL